MTLARRALVATRNVIASCVRAIDRTLQPAQPPEPDMDPEELDRLRRKAQRNELRASRLRWYQRRPVPIEVPESLRYYEAIHGTRATLEMIQRQSRKRSTDA